jgi:hypothetical protein
MKENLSDKEKNGTKLIWGREREHMLDNRYNKCFTK